MVDSLFKWSLVVYGKPATNSIYMTTSQVFPLAQLDGVTNFRSRMSSAAITNHKQAGFILGKQPTSKCGKDTARRTILRFWLGVALREALLLLMLACAESVEHALITFAICLVCLGRRLSSLFVPTARPNFLLTPNHPTNDHHGGPKLGTAKGELQVKVSVQRC